MKKFMLPLLALFFLFSCEDEITADLTSAGFSHDDSSVAALGLKKGNSNKRNVYHKGKIININVNAIQAHQAHGDAVDMDEDGYFDIDNPYSETDCDDTTYDPGNSCCEEGYEIDFEGESLFVALADEANSYTWQGAMNACAAKAAADGCGWFLPNKEELTAMFLERENIGGFDRTGTWPTSWYWSSTELYEGGGDANAQFFFFTGDQRIFNKVNGFRCRCVRR